MNNLYEAIFPQVLALVEKGYPISRALKRLGLSRWDFYNKCPKTLLSELQHVRATRSLKPATSGDCPEFNAMGYFPKAAMLNPFGENFDWEQGWEE